MHSHIMLKQNHCMFYMTVRKSFMFYLLPISAYFLEFALYSPLKCYSCENFKWSILNVCWALIICFKIGLLTKYTYDVGTVRSEFGVLVTTGTISLRHLLLKNWDASMETLPYPPAHGEFAVYSIRDLEDSVNFAVSQYYNAEQQATGYFTRTEDDNMDINIKYFTFNVTSGRYSKPEVKETSFKPDRGLFNHTIDGITLYGYNISKELQFQKLPSVLQSVLSIRINMSMHSVRVFANADARCFVIYANVTFNDDTHNGQVKVRLSTLTPSIHCSDMNYDVQDRDKRPLSEDGYYLSAAVFLWLSLLIEFVVFVIWIAVGCCRLCSISSRECCISCRKCCISSRECCISCRKCCISSRECCISIRKCCISTCASLKLKTVKHFWCDFAWGLFESSISLAGDIIAVCAMSKIHEMYPDKKTLIELDQWIVMLASGLLISYITLLRFVKFNKRFSIFFNTLKKSAVALICFLFIVVIIFIGFWLFGYIVLGTYHVKFNEPLKTADTLFSVINGDEIYATLAMLQDEYAGDDVLIDVIMHLFVYFYVTVFTVLIFNLLIALFNSAYEEVKKSSESTIDHEDNNLERHLTQLLKLSKKHFDGGQTLESLLDRLMERWKSVTPRNQKVDSLLNDVHATITNKPAANLTMEIVITELLKIVKKSSAGENELDNLFELIRNADVKRCQSGGCHFCL